MADYREGEVIPAPLDQWLHPDQQWIKSPGSYKIHCPTCGSGNARCNGVFSAHPSQVGWSGDGIATRLMFTCDKGHSWQFCFGVDSEQTWCWAQGAPKSGAGEPRLGPDFGPNILPFHGGEEYPNEGGEDESEDDKGYP